MTHLSNNHKKRLALLIILIVLGAVMLTIPDDKPKSWGEGEGSCYLRGDTCTVTVFGNKTRIQFSDPSFPLEQPIEVSVALPSPDVSISSAEVVGLNMYMGTMKFPFTYNDEEEGYNATLFIGSCSEPTMRWLMTFNFHQGDKRQQIALVFTTEVY